MIFLDEFPIEIPVSWLQIYLKWVQIIYLLNNINIFQ